VFYALSSVDTPASCTHCGLAEKKSKNLLNYQLTDGWKCDILQL